MTTRLLHTDTAAERAAAVAEAAGLLSCGEVVALPTETVYGLAADATSPNAVVKIFEAKERPLFDPLIVHLPTLAWLPLVADFENAVVERLIAKYWPGPLTLVLPRRDLIPDVVTSGLPTVALRMSAHPVFRAVVEHFGKPLAAPSANRFGRISPTAAEHVMNELEGRIPLVVNGGPTRFGIESTIVAVDGDRLRILRHGPITPNDLAPFGELEHAPAAESIEAPGQLKSHYAPGTPLQLVRNLDECPPLPGHRRGFLAWMSVPEPGCFERVERLSPAGDLREAAATLFSKLRALDEASLDLIIAETVPKIGLGLAIMDRLRKAAAR